MQAVQGLPFGNVCKKGFDMTAFDKMKELFPEREFDEEGNSAPFSSNDLWKGFQAALSHTVPEGCVVMPKVATPEMCKAAGEELEYGFEHTAGDIYQRMIAAAEKEGAK